MCCNLFLCQHCRVSQHVDEAICVSCLLSYLIDHRCLSGETAYEFAVFHLLCSPVNSIMSAAASVAKKAIKYTSYWRIAGLNYLEQTNITATALRQVLKEPFKSESLGRSLFKYREFPYAEGKELPPGMLHILRAITSLMLFRYGIRCTCESITVSYPFPYTHTYCYNHTCSRIVVFAVEFYSDPSLKK